MTTTERIRLLGYRDALEQRQVTYGRLIQIGQQLDTVRRDLECWEVAPNESRSYERSMSLLESMTDLLGSAKDRVSQLMMAKKAPEDF